MPPATTDRMKGNESTLSYDQVKAMSDDYHLPCKSIYELYAEFNSLKNIAIAELEEEIKQRDEFEFQDPEDQTEKIVRDA